MMLVQTFNHLGPDITNDVDTVRALLQWFGMTEANPPTDVQIVEFISTPARQAAGGAALGDVNAFVRALSNSVSGFATSRIDVAEMTDGYAVDDVKLGERHQSLRHPRPRQRRHRNPQTPHHHPTQQSPRSRTSRRHRLLDAMDELHIPTPPPRRAALPPRRYLQLRLTPW